MYDIEREQEIIRILKENKVIGVNDLANMVFCSTATIRRDLTRMERKGLVVRTFGAVSLCSLTPNSETSLEIREQSSLAAKRLLCQKVSSILSGNITVFVDSSSTLIQIVPFLKQFNNLLIITNGIKIANDIVTQTNHNVVVLGGTLQPYTLSIGGPHSYNQINSFHANYAIFSCAGFDENYGCSEVSEDAAEIKNIMSKNADKTILVFDSSKFNNTKTFRSVSLKNIDYIVTDMSLSEESKQKLRDQDVTLID